MLQIGKTAGACNRISLITANIVQTVSEIVEDLGSHQVPSDQGTRDERPAKGNVVDLEARKSGPRAICIPGLGRLDSCVALVLADFLKRQGVVATTAATAAGVESDAAEIICVCFLEDVTTARADFTIRKLSRRVPSANVVICLFGDASRGDDGKKHLEKSKIRFNRREQ